jgi:probable F420-dependent oxidoreductase
MKFGVLMFATDTGVPIDEIARAVEERGFESLWIPEHQHIPVDRVTPYTYAEDGVMPDMYWHTHDPFVALTWAAAATTHLKLGTGICLISQRDPIATAKQVASLDRYANGRFLFGVGAGWLAEEIEATGTPFASRWQVSAERMAAMKQIWTQDEPEYHGAFVDLPKTRIFPKPQQRPHPPVYIGATSAYSRQRVIDWEVDGWLPHIEAKHDLIGGATDLRDRAARAGRDPDSIRISVISDLPNAVDLCEQAAAERCIAIIPQAPAATVMAELDRLAKRIPGG